MSYPGVLGGFRWRVFEAAGGGGFGEVPGQGRTELRHGGFPSSVRSHCVGAALPRQAEKSFVYKGFLIGMLLAKPKVVTPLHNITGER